MPKGVSGWMPNIAKQTEGGGTSLLGGSWDLVSRGGGGDYNQF